MIKGTLQLQQEGQTSPSHLEADFSLLLINLFLHPFIFVMSLVFPVRDIKGNPSSVKETCCISFQSKPESAHFYSALYNVVLSTKNTDGQKTILVQVHVQEKS